MSRLRDSARRSIPRRAARAKSPPRRRGGLCRVVGRRRFERRLSLEAFESRVLLSGGGLASTSALVASPVAGGAEQVEVKAGVKGDTGEIHGVKFSDYNDDGVQETGEPGLPGWMIFADLDENGALDSGEPSTVTAADGSYALTGLAPGTYRVVEVPQSGYRASALDYLGTLADGDGTVSGLAGPWGDAVSPDGKNVYVAGHSVASLAAFRRDPATGRLDFLASYANGTDGISGLSYVTRLTVSPDGLNVYAVSESDHAVAVFRRDPNGGALSFVEVRTNGVAGVQGLAAPASVAVSLDGGSVYTASTSDNSLAVFHRDAATGALTFVEVLKDGVDGVDGLFNADGVVVSPDGNHVYATGAFDGAVAVFQRSAADGRLTFVEVQRQGENGVDGLNSPQGLAASADGLGIFVIGNDANGQNAVAVFTRDPATGRLTFLEAVGGGPPGSLSLGGVAAGANGTRVYATAVGTSALLVYDRDPASGHLTFVEARVDGSAGTSGINTPFGVAVSPDNGHVYVTGSGGDSLAVFATDAGTGGLDFVEAVVNGGGIHGLAGASDVAVGPAGDYVFASTAAPGGAAVLRRDPADSSLTFVGSLQNGRDGAEGMGGAGNLAVGPEGNDLYVAGYSDNGMAHLRFDPGTGVLTFSEAYYVTDPGFVPGLSGPRGLAISPDGRSLYTAGSLDNAVAVFSRDPATGVLEHVESQQNLSGGVHGLAGVSALALSPDGEFLYAAAAGDSALAAFSRDPASGGLTFVEWQQNGTAGVSGLGGAEDLAISPDGTNVYVAAASDGALAVFDRDASTGRLTFVNAITDGGGVSGLGGAHRVTVSPDGKFVYAAGRLDGTLVVFARDPATGALQFAGLRHDAPGGITGLASPDGLAVSPDGSGVYVAGQSESSVAAFLAHEPGIYTVALAEAQVLSGVDFPGHDVVPPTAAILAVDHDPRETPVNLLTIAFSEPIQGLTLSGLELSRDGGANLLTGAETLTSTEGGKTWTLSGLGTLTAEPGAYQALLHASSGVEDLSANPLAADASQTWTTNPLSATLDVDGNGRYDALTDGLLILRSLFGFGGSSLTAGALGSGATRTDPADVAAYLQAAADSMLDADGSGTPDALTDGLLILRYFFGFSGTSLTSGALGPEAKRTDPQAVADFLDGYAPATGARPAGLVASPTKQGQAVKGTAAVAESAASSGSPARPHDAVMAWFARPAADRDRDGASAVSRAKRRPAVSFEEMKRE